MSEQSGSLAERLQEVAMEHMRGDWSDNTYTCQGCERHTREEVEALWPNADGDEQRRELRSKLNKASKPDWTRKQYAAHLADATAHVVEAWLGEQREAMRVHVRAAGLAAMNAIDQQDAGLATAMSHPQADAAIAALRAWIWVTA